MAIRRITSGKCGVAILFLAVFGLSLCGASKANTKRLCPSAEEQASGEGQWKIPEEAFTEQAARRELRKLNWLLGSDGRAAEAVAWETSFVFIEGWYLRRQALAEQLRGEPGVAVADFCDFLKRRAVVRH